MSLLIDADRTDHVVRAELQAVDVDHQQPRLGEVPLRQLLEQSFSRLDELPRDLTLRDA